MDAEVDSRLLHYDLARCFTLQDLLNTSNFGRVNFCKSLI